MAQRVAGAVAAAQERAAASQARAVEMAREHAASERRQAVAYAEAAASQLVEAARKEVEVARQEAATAAAARDQAKAAARAVVAQIKALREQQQQAAAAAVAEPLPAGWEALVTEEGDDYFYCEYTGETRWDRPTAADAAPAARAALPPPGQAAGAAAPMEVGSADDDWGWGEGTIDGEGSGGAWGDALPGAERHLVGAGAPWDDAWGTAVPPAQGASGQESVASAELTRAEVSGAEAAVVRELAAAATQLGDMQGALRLALQGGPIGLQGEAGAVQPVERIVESGGVESGGVEEVGGG